MKKLKAVFILLSTLAIGFILGLLISGQITQKRMNEFVRWGSKEGFKEIMYETIEPEEKQMIQLEPIIEKHARFNEELHKRWKKEHGELMRGLTKELEEVLTPEQILIWRNLGKSVKEN